MYLLYTIKYLKRYLNNVSNIYNSTEKVNDHYLKKFYGKPMPEIVIILM